MDYDELLHSYEAILIEKADLVRENERLRALLGLDPIPVKDDSVLSMQHETQENELPSSTSGSVGKTTAPSEKIRLFMSLFRGRDDVYPKRWENQKGLSGYSPVCINEWRQGICMKPKMKCSNCAAQSYSELNEGVIESHLKGKSVIGVYPLLQDDTSWFLVLDFDDEHWEKDIEAIWAVCDEFGIPIAVERSRSGNGAHLWFFFDKPIAASLARRFGAALLTHSMNRRHELSFNSYDRMFPNQDTMPKGGFGNLIALPLQQTARKQGNSEFVDESLTPYQDQWAFLAVVRRLTSDNLKQLISILAPGNELGSLKRDEESDEKPWEVKNPLLNCEEIPPIIKVVRGNMLYISKQGLSDRVLNQIKRLAAFRNPEFYKAQAMRMSTFGKPRIISCADEDESYIYLPRGCDHSLTCMFEEWGAQINWMDKTNCGRPIDIEFNGILREDQPKAVSELMRRDIGVLSGTTAFGKTVVALKLIAERKVNTLIIVDKVSLVSQWKDRISQFLVINETLPESEPSKKRGRKKKVSVIGQIGAGKDQAGGIIDIAVMQSLNRKGEVKELVRNYGMVIVDECHHISAFSFEEVLKHVNARYVYGLTATPARKDGHHPIIFMQCGPIIFRDDAIKQAFKRPFEHYVVPRFTSFRLPTWQQESDLSIQDVYSELVKSEIRNEQIVEDVIRSYESGRNCIILTGRTAHVELLANKLSIKIPDVITLTGGMGTKDTREAMNRLRSAPVSVPVVVVATGKYVGEGFDEPRLDTLFLAMPISWKGTLQQYAGRLHRLYEGKSEVQVYDYVDLHVRVLGKMHSRRLSGYASIGYMAKGERIDDEAADIIFDKQSFLPIFSQDMLNSRREILIVSPFVTKRRAYQMLESLRTPLQQGVRVTVVTRPLDSSSGDGYDDLNETLKVLEQAGIEIVFKPNIHQKFAILDQKIVWYSSINLLSYGSAEESMMRLVNGNIAFELMKVI